MASVLANPGAAAPAAAQSPTETRSLGLGPAPTLPMASGLIAGIIVAHLARSPAEAARSLGIIVALAVCGWMAIPTIRQHFRVVLVFLLAMLAGALRLTVEQTTSSLDISRQCGEEHLLARITGIVRSEGQMAPPAARNPFAAVPLGPRHTFVLECQELEGPDGPIRTTGLVRVTAALRNVADATPAHIGQKLRVTGRLSRPSPPKNPGEVDWRAWLERQGIRAQVSLEGPQYVTVVEDRADRLHAGLTAIRAGAQRLLFEPYVGTPDNEATSLLDTMILGNRSAISRQLNDAFVRTGTIHILSVSGFHMAALVGLVWLILRKLLRLGERLTLLLAIGFVILYVLIAEPNAPMLRSGIMIVCYCIGRLSGRKPIALNALGLAAVCILVWKPLDLFSPGFQLSFLQVLALAVVFGPLQRAAVSAAGGPDRDVHSPAALLWRKTWHAIVGAAIVSLLAWAVSLPLVMMHFGRFAPWAALQSMLLALPVALATVMGFVTMLLSWTPLAIVIAPVARLATASLILGVEKLAQFPHSLVMVRPPPIWLVAVTYAVILALALELRGARILRPFATRVTRALPGLRRHSFASRASAVHAVTALLALCGPWVIWQITLARDLDVARVTALALGDGAATMAWAREAGGGLVIDVGTNQNLDAGQCIIDAAATLGVARISGVVISHGNFDHFSGAPVLNRFWRLDDFWTSSYVAPGPRPDAPASRFLREMPAPRPLSEGAHLGFGAANIEVLWPPDDLDLHWNDNDSSLVLRLSAAGRTVMLPGDIERRSLRQLVQRHRGGHVDLRSDVLIAPHHGSFVARDTESFLHCVAPRCLIVSAAKPRGKLMDLMARRFPDCRVLTTGQCGAVTVHVTSDGQLRVETFR